MSSPMHDIPEHMPIPVTEDGRGPVVPEADAHHWACWCGNADCEEGGTGDLEELTAAQAARLQRDADKRRAARREASGWDA